MTRALESLLSLVVLAAACGDFAADGATSVGPEDAATPRPAPDADQPVPPPPPPASDAGGIPSDAQGPDGGLTPGTGAQRDDWAACGDRAAEADGRVDCASDSCATAPLCCADSEACCVSGPVSLVIDFGACAPGPADACATGLVPLSGPAPLVVEEGGARALWLAPAGESSSGLASFEVLDPSTAVEAGVSVLTRGGCPPGACQEMLGVGLGDADVTSPDGARLSAVLSVATGQLLLLSEGEVLRRAPVDFVEPASGRLSISLDATGDAVARYRGDRGTELTLTAAAPARFSRPVRVLVFGRGENAREARALALGLDVSTRVCDRPAQWTIDAVTVTNARELPTPWKAIAVADRPASDGAPERRFVVEAGGRLFAGSRTEEGLTLDSGAEGALTGEYADGATGPESLGSLLWLADRGRWELIVARGGRDIASIPSTSGAVFDRSAAVVLLTASQVGAASIDQPSAAVDFRGHWTLAYRVADSGAGRIGTAGSEGGFVFVVDDDAVAPSEHPAAFDRDGVEAPSVIAYNELVHLYYTGRRGVARSLGLARRTFTGGWERYGLGSPVLSPGPEAWRTFGVAAPAVALTPDDGATTGTLDLYFLATGNDGTTLQRAHRAVRWEGR